MLLAIFPRFSHFLKSSLLDADLTKLDCGPEAGFNGPLAVFNDLDVRLHVHLHVDQHSILPLDLRLMMSQGKNAVSKNYDLQFNCQVDNVIVIAYTCLIISSTNTAIKALYLI